jgi:hypothetical protein
MLSWKVMVDCAARFAAKAVTGSIAKWFFSTDSRDGDSFHL